MGLIKRLKAALFPPKIPKCICGSVQQQDKIVYANKDGHIFRLQVLKCPVCPVITVIDTLEARQFAEELRKGNIPEFDNNLPKGDDIKRWWTQ